MIVAKVTASLGVLILWGLSHMHISNVPDPLFHAWDLVLVYLFGHRSDRECGYSMFLETLQAVGLRESIFNILLLKNQNPP